MRDVLCVMCHEVAVRGSVHVKDGKKDPARFRGWRDLVKQGKEMESHQRKFGENGT